jgi:S-adenosylmethionine:tRNA ribosyltransferase-isomerase
MKNDVLKTDSYDYYLPPYLIASYPANPLDNAKLFIYNTTEDKIYHDRFYNLLNYIPNDTAVVFNNTKVIKARIFGTKSTGGKVELLINKPLSDNKSYEVYIKGKVKKDTILNFKSDLVAKVLSLNDDGSRIVEFYKNNKVIEYYSLVALLETIGHVPLPPYINRKDTVDDINTYQTLFAQKSGAVAAPTASLHFTPELLNRLKDKFKTQYITLHIGAGTFKPIDSKNILSHKMHSEYFEIQQPTKEIIDKKIDILAVGTTVTRTIEYYYRTGKTKGECDLFLNPTNPPQRVNYLLTNFHLPKSTLIMLVSSFIGLEKTMMLYQEAINKEYRFFSYGDAMLII